MSKCLFCKKEIPPERYTKWHHKIKYCSPICGKRYIYLKNTKHKTSFFKNKNEWLLTNMGKGYYWEVFANNILKGELQKFGSSFDILWKGKKVDVKSSSLYKRKYKRGKPVKGEQTGWFTFHKYSRKKKDGIDYLFCIGVIENKPYKMWLIPFDKVNKVFCITPNPSKKYDKYLFYSFT